MGDPEVSGIRVHVVKLRKNQREIYITKKKKLGRPDVGGARL